MTAVQARSLRLARSITAGALTRGQLEHREATPEQVLSSCVYTPRYIAILGGVVASSTNKQSVAFRFDRTTVKRLKERAREAHAAQTALAERYIEEGLRHDEHPLIFFRDGEAGRRPALLGTRLGVADVITTIRQNGNSLEQAADYLEIPVEYVDACVRYYADYKDEIDSWIEHSRAIAQRERERWQRRQQALV